MGSMYANALMWVEQYIPVNDRVAAILNGCGAVGATLSPLFIGKSDFTWSESYSTDLNNFNNEFTDSAFGESFRSALFPFLEPQKLAHILHLNLLKATFFRNSYWPRAHDLGIRPVGGHPLNLGPFLGRCNCR